MSDIKRELTVKDLVYSCPEQWVSDFLSRPISEDKLCVVGQQEPLSILQLAGQTRVENIYVSGLPGTGRTGLTIETLKRLAKDKKTPDDICYVQNFQDSTKPRKLILAPGMGKKLAETLKVKVKLLRKGLEQKLTGEEIETARASLKREFEERIREELMQVEKFAQGLGLSLRRTEMGLVAVPVQEEKDQGEIQKPKDRGETPHDIADEPKNPSNWEESAARVREAIAAAWQRIEKMQQELNKQLEEVEEQVIADFVHEVVGSAAEEWQETDAAKYFDELIADLKEQIPLLRNALAAGNIDTATLTRFWQRYEVNCLVCRKPQDGAPVVYEPNPTHSNVFGEQEYHADGKVATTNHMYLKSGAIHRANGGWLVLPAWEVLTNQHTWNLLKQALKRKRISFANLEIGLRLFPVGTLEPEEMELDVQVVLIGTPQIYYLLYQMDPDFVELFRYKVEFTDVLPLTAEGVRQYVQYILQTCRTEHLPACSAGAAVRLVEYGIRLTNNKSKLSAQMGEIRELLREAAAWARLHGKEVISANDVQTVISHREKRSDLVWRRLLEQIKQGQLLIQTFGSAVGEVNGLAIFDLGDLQFARPVRITANAYLGQQGLTHIEREIQLSGKIHSKGVLTIAGYFGAKYGQERSISLSASICFEQSYGEIEGDSASAAELLALLSSVSLVPFRQDLAITGSVNQKGKIQAVGGVTTKVEGYFRVCQLLGLTGSQGVVIPAANVENLVLKPEVLQAIEKGMFHIYPVSDIDEAVELFVDPEWEITAEQLHRRVEKRLDEWWQLLEHREQKES